MANPKYLKLDANLYESPLGCELLERFGCDGIGFYTYLLCAIRHNGYHITVDAGFTQRAAAKLHISVDKLRQIFALLMEHKAFDQTLYRTLRVLTSEEIQQEYFRRTKKAGTPPIWLISCGTSRQVQEIILPESFSLLLDQTVREWLRYKRERGESYTETGLRALIREIESHRLAHGDEKICGLINYSMSNSYQGIPWDRLERGVYPGKPVTQNRSAVTAGSSIDKNELQDLINQQFFGKKTG